MTNINKVSQAIIAQTPEFIESDYPLFNRFLEYYYQSQEKTGLGQNILNNFLGYLDIDRLDVGILDGKTKLVEAITSTSDTIVVESIDQFLEKSGSILIGNEVIYYEDTTSSPNIALSPGISYDQVKLKFVNLASPINSFDGTTQIFNLTSQDNPIAPPTAQHLIVSVYGEVLTPGVDYSVSGTQITYNSAPRTKIPSDDAINTYITYLDGFVENPIVALDNISNSFGEQKKQFRMTRNGTAYEPIVDEYVIAVYDKKLLIPKVDYFVDGADFIFAVPPTNGRFLSLYSIEAPVPSFGSGAEGFARINDTGALTGISTNLNGSNYRFEYPPKVSINSPVGSGGSATALVNGIKTVTLLDGGRGYSDSNPPVVQIQSPTKTGSTQATMTATVTNGQVTAVELQGSGSGYTFTPRITFRQPGGATVATPTVSHYHHGSGGSITGGLTITNPGFGYTTPPAVYVDEPTGNNPIRASFQTVLAADGTIASITTINAGQGYTSVPRVAIVDPVGAQVLQTVVDGDGRVIRIDLLDGGSGYDEIPSVYIVDSRVDATGAYAGGTGATATASIFNGAITDINVTAFGSGYSAASPPSVVIQAPPSAEASAEIGLNEVTGFKVNQSGSGYQKAAFTGCARAASGIVEYTEDGNAVFSNDTTAEAGAIETEVKCLDALFVKRLLDKYTQQFLPDVPELDYTKIDVRTAIKTIKDFYSAKGTSFSIAYLFKLLYGETVSISYPKDQIIKPSAATWSIDTILRATKVSGLATDIQDGLLQQEADIADPNVRAASALVENYISIKTSTVEIFELVLSEETITGTFTVPYKTKLAEPLNATDSIITVDSTIGWPERNGEFVIGSGATTELVQYKEKSLNQFIECTRSVNGVVEDWDSATEVASNFQVKINKGTPQEVVMNVVGIVDAQQTSLTDTGSYYLQGDKLTVSKLGGTGTLPLLTTWLYNVKKLITVSGITFGGVNNQSATVTCSNNHGLLVGDQVTVYGANPIIYNGTFTVTSRDSETVFQYALPQPAAIIPQGNILVSVDLNKGKSETTAILNAIGPYTTNIQNSFFNDNYTYVASTGIPNYSIGPFPGSALLPGNQRKLNRFPTLPTTISTKNAINSGPIGTWVNGVSVWSYKSTQSKTFGAVTSIAIANAGQGYDAASPPVITISGGGGSGATASVIVNGSISEITVTEGGSGYTSSPLVSIVGGGGSGAAATAIITKGVVSRILINSGGTGYTSQPSITIVGGGGTGAAGTASVRGPISTVNITSGGSSYTSSPNVSLSSGSGAVAQPIVSNGRIISIAIISAGSGYTTAPEISIQGVGFGAVARATIDTDGENAGRVTSITIVNRGIGYVQGTTLINMTSVGQDATFTPSVFKWTYNLQATSTLDAAKGGVFEGYNNQYGGEYAHLSNPQKLRFILGDNLQEVTAGTITEQETQLTHSPIIGWAFDGNPIYGPYGYTDPTDQSSEITRLRTSYRLKTDLVYDIATNPTPVRTAGPLLSVEPAGNFVEDYEYVFNLGDLDQYNGRFCKTPDYPTGRYCYFVTIDATEAGNPEFPYVLGPSFNSVVDSWNLSTSAVQQNIPTGVVRYRDPYENVDIDVERAPNASTNALTTEDGLILLFDPEDTNRDGQISAEEQDDINLGQLFEESPLQLFDYFPKVRFDSKVDIEVETTNKFEDANVTGFTIENSGQSYQVNDRLVFDNTGTGGDGASARVSRIKGETVSAYTFESISGNNFGVLTTSNPHNLVAGDSIFVDYQPVMDNTNKQFTVRQYRGIEEIQITQTGSGYNTDIPPTIIIDSASGQDGELQAVVSSVGSIDQVNIVNSGSGYTTNPRVILSHPQIFKKADYYLSLINNNNYVKVNDVKVNLNKEVFICGKTKDASGNVVAFVSKLSATGVKEWSKTLESSDGLNYTEFESLFVDGNDIWVTGINKPNSSILNAYNPDVILCKYTQAANGLSATLAFQKAYAGISGSTRADHITIIKKYSDTRYIIGGYTNTNSANPDDAFIASIDTSGNFAIKRKFASANKSERITDIICNYNSVSGGSDVYFCMETAADANAADVDVAVGKCQIGVNAITVDWINTYASNLFSMINTSMAIDEFDEIYINATCRQKANDIDRDSIWVGKIDSTGALLWNYRYLAPGRDVTSCGKSAIDLFGDLNVAFTRDNNDNEYKTLDILKIGYNGTIRNHTTTEFTADNIEGLQAHTLAVDTSGDVHVFGQTYWNRNEFVIPFTSSAITDTTTHYTPAVTLTGDSFSYDDTNGWGKILGATTAAPSVWANTNIKFAGTDLGQKLAGDWTIEFFIFKDATNSNVFSQPKETLFAIGDATVSTGGLHLFYDQSSAGPSGPLTMTITNSSTSINSAGSSLTSSQTNLYADNTWQAIAVTKSGDTFKAYVNGIEVLTGTISGTSLGAKDLYFGNIPGANGTLGQFRSNEQGQYHIDHLRFRNRAVTPSVPSDITSLPSAGQFGLAYDWVDDAWFTDAMSRYDYIEYAGFGIKTDKNADATRLGNQGKKPNSGITFTRTAVTPVVGSPLTINVNGFALGDAGYQSLDFDDSTTTMTEDTETLSHVQDVWSSRTATVPSPGSQKLKVTAVVRDRYYFKVTPTIKIDNVQALTINQAFNFSVGSKLVLKNDSGQFVNSGYIIRKDNENNIVYLAVNNNAWSNDLNTGQLSTEQFNEQSNYGITGAIPNDINEITNYTFAEINNQTPGTFIINLDNFDLDGTVADIPATIALTAAGTGYPNTGDSIPTTTTNGEATGLIVNYTASGGVIQSVTIGNAAGTGYKVGDEVVISGGNGDAKFTINSCTGNLDSFATFKPYADADYSVRIDQVSGSSAYIVGSVVTIGAGAITWNADYSQATISGLTGVLKITLVANLTKILQATAVANSDEVYVITNTSHYLETGDMVYVDGNPQQTIGATVYDEYDGAFAVQSVVSPLEFTYKLKSAALTAPATNASDVSIFIKSPTLKMYYGHQYLFDLSHSSMAGGNLSFAKDNLYKLEYSFNSIERVGIPGVTGGGQPTPTVKLKVDRDIVTNISYYFDPSRTGDDSPVVPGSYLDVVDSPYNGTFEISSVAGATITKGADILKFPLANEPEGPATISQATYMTSSTKAVGSIGDIRIVNPGGFYTKLPIVSGITSSRQIERVQINAPGTEYAVGTYSGVPISGDGEGGFVSITVADGTDAEGSTIPGQISNVVVTSPGKNYTTANIDINAIQGILGSGLTGSGAELVVVIPSAGTGASIFTSGTNVGKIKKLKNNNFGYDYPHDYTLRPEISFPINAQLTSTSILDSITITDPGTGYSQAPAVVITGGGGSGAIAEATIKNGRLDVVIVKDPGSGYSSTPTVALRSSFNYVINLDLGLLQFAFPHGIANGAAVTLNVVDTGDGAEFPLASGAVGRLNSTTTYYAISGTANSLEDDQLKLAITPANAELGDALSFSNAGTGRQQVLTESFGGAAEANVITSTFLEGELVYQGDSLDTATATGFVSTNSGWQVGPRVLKIVDYTGDFAANQRITGVISKSSGIITDLKIARGVLEIGSITKTTGQFIDDVGKPSEIIQKIQDSYYYQDFSYAVKSSTSISEWKEILIKNVHPASFKVFGELNLNEYGFIPNKETFFQLTKSVELAQEAIVPNIQNFALVEPVYTAFNNTEVLFRQKRLTSSENILTSVVQRIDDISNLFDGQRTAFPLQVNQTNIVANANQLMIVLNGVVQTPGTAFSIQQDSIVFVEPPQPPASVKYVNVTINTIATTDLSFTNISGIFPNISNVVVGTSSNARLTVTKVVGNIITGFITQGTFVPGELVTVSATGFSANYASATSPAYESGGLFIFNETVTNFEGNTAKVERVNLQTGQETPLAQLRYTIGLSTSSIEVVKYRTDNTAADEPVPAGTFVATKNYQFGSEIVTVNTITQNNDSTTLGVTRAQSGTTAVSHQEDVPVYGTDISVTNQLTLSKTAGTYQSTPGLFDIQLNDYIIAAQSGVVAQVTASSVYQDPTTQEFIGQVNISPGSSFFGLLFNRITSQTYPNVVLDNIANSQVNIVNFTDNNTPFNENFPANEQINNYVIPYDNASGALTEGEDIRNYKLEYGNSNGDFDQSEDAKIRKLTFDSQKGTGFFVAGQNIRIGSLAEGEGTKAEVVGYSQARQTVYLGKIGRCQYNGQDIHAITFAGNAQLSTASFKFGGSSLLLDGTGDYVNIASSTEFGWGTGAFTLEFWVNPGSGAISGTTTLLDQRENATEVAARVYLEAAQVRYNVNGSDLVTSGATTLNNATWYHIAIVRSSTTTKIYINGAEAGTGTDSSNFAAKPVRIGMDYNGANGFEGYIDEVRLSSTNRYTSAFTSPTGIFQGDTNAKLLIHFDGSNGQTYTEDWSGYVAPAIGDEFNNDSILATSRTTGAPAGFVGRTHRYLNAADHILINKELIKAEALYIMKQVFPAHTVKGGDSVQLARLEVLIQALVDDLRNGSNSHIWNTSASYINRATNPISIATGTIEGDVPQEVYATEIVEKISKFVINNVPWDIQDTSHSFVQKYDGTLKDSDYPSAVNFTPTGATYNAATGDMVLTSSSHGLLSPREITATNATYTATTGVLGITSNGHNLQTGDRIKLKPNSITMTCTSDGNTVSQSYPRPDDPAAQGWMEVTRIDANNFSINVGKSPTVNYTVTDGTYDGETGFLTMDIGDNDLRTGWKYTPEGAAYNPSTGVMTITIANHGFYIGDRVMFDVNSLVFTCGQDSNATDHPYPRITDPYYNKWIAISNVTTNTFDVNVGTSSNTTTHVFKYALPNSMVRSGETLRLSKDAVSFKCSQDNFRTIHSYPRTDDPGYNTSLPIWTNGTPLTATNAIYSQDTGDMVITIPNHGLTLTDEVRIELNSLTFACTKDGNKTTHSYPRATDPAAQRWLRIEEKTDNTIKVNVGIGAIEDQYVHTFVSALEHSIIKRDNTITVNIGKSPTVNYTPTGGTYNATTGALELTIGNHSLPAPTTHTVTNAVYIPSTGIMTLTIAGHNFSNGEKIKIADNSLRFTCAQDNNATNHDYPRSTDAVSNKWIPIFNVTTDTFDVQVLDNIPSTNVTAHTFVSATSGGVSKANSTIKLAPNSLVFTCTEDSNATDHLYPRSEQDRHTATTGTNYNPVTGVMTVTTAAAHGFRTGTPIMFQDLSLTFTCGEDNNATLHPYPRSTDYASNRWLFVSSVPSTTTFTVNVLDKIPSTNTTTHTFVSAIKGGIIEGDPLVAQAVPIDAKTSTTITINALDGYTPSNTTSHTLSAIVNNQYTPNGATYDATTGVMELTFPTTNYTPTNATYNPTTGDMVLTIGAHTLMVGDTVRIQPNSITFTCTLDGNTAQKTYPRASSNDYAYNYDLTVTDETNTTITVNVNGDGTPISDLSAHTFVSASTNAVQYGHQIKEYEKIQLADGAVTFSCSMDGNSSNKAYPRSTDPISGKWMEVFNVDYNKLSINVGKSPLRQFTPTHADYNPTTGFMTLTIGRHNLRRGTAVKIATNSITFRCAQDDYATDHSYPRTTDPNYNTAVTITDVTDDTITVQTLASTPSTNTSNHIFVSATANSITTGGNYSHTFVSATSNGVTRALLQTGGNYTHKFASGLANGVSTGGNYTHTFVSATTNGIDVAGDSVIISDNSISFTCTKDNNTTTHTYPRSTDPASAQVLPISAHTTDTFTVNVGASKADDQYAHTFTAADSNAVTKVFYSLSDCSDVITTQTNLVSILTDTLNNAITASPTDHLASVTSVSPAAEFIGGRVKGFKEVPFPVSYHDATNDLIYTNQIDVDGQYRFRDAAYLIRANSSVIVDKTAYDMLQRYPDLALDMPRNANGTSTDGTLRCKTDLGLIVSAIANDIENGGNEKSVEAASFYLGNNNEVRHIRLQIQQSVYAHERLAVYIKEAIGGDLTYDNTDDIITGDWDTVGNNVSTYFDGVKTEVDNLITTINDMIAPTNNDFAIGADRLYFNRQYIVEEVTGLTTTEFTYSLNAITYNAFSYPGSGRTEVVVQDNLKDILLGVISDLQTGGTNSTIQAMETYLNASLQIQTIEDELPAFIYAIEQMGVIGEFALNNRLYDFNSGFTAPDYAALKTDETAYRDTESPTSISTVITRFKELIKIAVNFLSPARLTGRSAAKHILYNYNYYKEEITQQVNTQFGAGSWTYDTFLTNITDDMVHDIITTDLSDKTTAYEITLTSNIGNYQVGEVIHSSNGAYAKVLEWNEDTTFLVVAPFVGTQWANGNTIVGRTSLAVGVVNAVGSGYDWYNNPTNVQTIAHARTLSSNITGQIAGINLFTNPEAIATDWTATEASIVNNNIAAPDLTITSEKIVPSTNNALHTLNRNFNLNAFDTFDDGTIKFDATNQRFDEGAVTLTASQTFTFSAFIKAGGYTSVRFQMALDEGTSAVQRIFFDLNLTTGTIGSVFTPQGGMINEAAGVVPLGNGWYRAFITTTFSFGFSTLSNKIIINNASGAQSYAGDGTSGIYLWGVKLTKGALDPYQSGDGTVFFSDNEYNIKQYAINTLQTYMQQALDNTLTEPSPNAGFYKFYDSAEAANYTTKSIGRLIRYNLDIIRNQIKTGTYYTQITSQSGITVPAKTYGARSLPVGLSGGISNADYAYGLSSNVYGEIESIVENSGKIVQVYQRFRIDGDITDGPYTMNEVVQKQGNASVTGVVYGFHEDENYKYLDVKVTAGPWAITDNIVGATNSTTAQISAIESRIHIIDLEGDFPDNIPFKGYTSTNTAQPAGTFLKNEAAVTDNTGGTLTVDTATLLGSFEVNSVVYPESSRQFLDVIKYDGLELKVGAKIASTGNIRFGISIISNLATFTVGNRLYKIVSGVQDLNTYAIITGVDIPNNYVYAQEFQGTLTNGDIVGDYGVSSFPQGYASITTKVVTAGAATATVQDIKTVGTLKRVYLSDVVGSFDTNDAVKSIDNYKAAVFSKGDLKARVKRSFKGFDGVQTTFNLSQNNGTTYLPDPAGHLLIFINGILQPPGATNAYTAFSNQIQFTEAPDLGASFTGFYVGKLRQLDDISFEFDSLRQSFNLKRNDVFYSLTLTDGVQSSTIRPENNIICSLNGVIQEPGIGFEIVGSRIIFSEIPRVGSTFVAFSYVGSEADVDAAEIVPPVEPGDDIRIQGETEDRTVAVIESSNSLITFDYLGSVFGQDATATAALTTGFIKQVQVTSGGSSYTTRPTVRVDSISGFEGNIRALVGVGGVTMSNTGSGYQNPDIAVETVVPDDWTAPDLSQYGEEVVDPEIIT